MSRFEFNKNLALDIIADRFADRVETTGLRIADKARELAPVGKDKGSNEPVTLKPASAITSLRLQGVRRQLVGETQARKVRVFREFVRNRPQKATELSARREFAKIFRFRSGGGSPEEIIETPKGLRGRRLSKEHGNLRKSIRFEGVERDGHVITGKVAARIHYAAAIEKGWHGRTPKSRGNKPFQGPAQPYLYPAMDSERDDFKRPLSKG